LLQRREAETLRRDHAVDDPPVGAPLRGRVDKPASQHREHRIRQRPRHPRLAPDRVEQPLKPEVVPQLPHRGHRADHRCLLDRQAVEIDLVTLGVGLQGGDDPVELAGLAQRRCLPEPKQGPVGVLAVDADRLDQGQVLVGPVGPAHTLRLDEHAGSIPPAPPSRNHRTRKCCPYIPGLDERYFAAKRPETPEYAGATSPEPHLVSNSGLKDPCGGRRGTAAVFGVLAVLHEPEHVDLAVTQVWARLLDAGTYLCSIATMYRILRDAGESRERRRQRTHPAKTKPQLRATGPNQCWSWDIERHEALWNRAVVKGHRLRPVAAGW
jgi:hypothetical protein